MTGGYSDHIVTQHFNFKLHLSTKTTSTSIALQASCLSIHCDAMWDMMDWGVGKIGRVVECPFFNSLIKYTDGQILIICVEILCDNCIVFVLLSIFVLLVLFFIDFLAAYPAPMDLFTTIYL